jgi:hypothetical protein
MQPLLLGGLFIGVLSALPIVQLCNCCCVWIVGGGVLAAYLQQQNQPASMTVLDGARAGMFAGLIGAFVWLIVTQALDVVLAPLQQRVMTEVLRNARDLPPEVRAMLENADRSGGYAFSFALMLIFGSLVAALGGAAGAAYFRKDVPPALGGPVPPPPLP